MKLANKMILSFMVVIGLCVGYGSAVFYQGTNQIKAEMPNADPGLTAVIEKLQTTSLAVGVLGAILGCLVCFFLVKQVVSPITAINAALKTYLEKGKPVRIEIPNKDELGIMALYLNELLAEKRRI